MNPQMNLEKLKKSLQSDVYVDLVAFLAQAVEKLSDINNVKELDDPLAQAIELKATKKAHKRLTRILGRIIDFGSSEKEKPDLGENDYGVDEDESGTT